MFFSQTRLEFKPIGMRVQQLSLRLVKFVNLLNKHGCLFVFVALRPKSTAMVIAGRSVHLTTLFPGQA